MRVNVFKEGSEKVIWYKVKKHDSLVIPLLTTTHLLKERFLGDQEIIENLIVSIIYTQVYHWILEKKIYYSIMQQIKFAGQFIDLNAGGTFESDRLGFRLDFLFR
jgi:glutamine amidotransferase-like uncharacterized protein